MAKKMMMNVKTWLCSLQNHDSLIIKLVITFLLMGFAVRYHFSRSSSFNGVSENDQSISFNGVSENDPFLKDGVNSTPPIFSNVTETSDKISPRENTEKCNLFIGDWVPNPNGPAYTNETCNLMETPKNCMTNGRPDFNYLYWRWNPRDCELPQLNPEIFLEKMRNKSWAFIGDSISRNHVESLLCILSKVDPPVQIYHDEEYKSKKWRFDSYNFTVAVIWSPFLAQSAIYEDANGVSNRAIELHIDKLDNNWTQQYKTFDHIIFSSGKWFIKTAIYYENDTRLGCHNCPKPNMTELGFNFAYRKVLKKVFDFIVDSNHKGVIFYRTSTPDHFENGEWFSGGNCNRTEPVKEGEYELPLLNRILREVELEEFEKAVGKASEKGVNLKLFDVTPLSLMRPDGHPGPYRYFQPFAKDKNAKIINDCLHWCLPGPIDSWNDLLMEMVISG